MTARHHFPDDLTRAATVAKGKPLAEFFAGGTDVYERARHHESSISDLVHLGRVKGLGDISRDVTGDLSIGSAVSLATLVDDVLVRRAVPLLVKATNATANPQVRAAASLGGALAQTVRCWYFRHPDVQCLRAGGDTCFARDGENDHHAIFEIGSCVAVHPSTLGTVLLALDATVMVRGSTGPERAMSAAAFFDVNVFDPAADNALQHGEVIQRVVFPAPGPTHAHYVRASARRFADWADVEVSVAYTLRGHVVENARIVLGAVARTPRRAPAAEALLNGQTLTPERIRLAAAKATEGARPLRHNAHKVALVERCVWTALEGAQDG